MSRLLLPIFIAVPILEIYLLITVGGLIGVWPTLLLILTTAVVGVTLLRQQGLATLQRAQLALSRGEAPATMLLEGLVLLISGLLLLTPGFFTDAIGFLGLTPLFRRRFAVALVSRLQSHGFHHAPGGAQQRTGQETIEGEYWRDEDR